jgi:hypothetical protein
MKTLVTASLFALLIACSGCGHQHDDKAAGNGQDEKIKANLAKLNDEDQKLVAAQEYCAVESENRLGAMGPPVKVTVKDQPVFLCCKHCQEEALKDPDATLEKVAELKKKAKTK